MIVWFVWGGGGNDNFEIVDGLVYNGDTLLLKLGSYPNSNPAIREGTTSIDGNAFEYDEIITSVQIPDSVTNIGRLAFANCPNLEQVDLGNGISLQGSRERWSLRCFAMGRSRSRWRSWTARARWCAAWKMTEAASLRPR